MADWGFAEAMLGDTLMTPKKVRDFTFIVRMTIAGVCPADIKFDIWTWLVRSCMCYNKCRVLGCNDVAHEWDRAIFKPTHRDYIEVKDFGSPGVAEIRGPHVREIKEFLTPLLDRPSQRYAPWTNDLTALLHDLSRMEAAMSEQVLPAD